MKNKIILEDFSMKESKLNPGIFNFNTIIIGKHNTCNSSINTIGFISQDFRWSCAQTNEYYNGSLIEGCKCTYSCINCIPFGNKQTVIMSFQDYIMSPMILFSTSVNYYVENSFYSITGLIESEDNLFTGDSKSHLVSMNLNIIRYISISILNSIFEIFSHFPIEYVQEGYILQLMSKIPGSSLPWNKFEIKQGMKITFEITPVLGVKILYEQILQNLFIFFAQILSLFSVSIVLGNIFYNLLELIILTYEVVKNKLISKKVNPIEIIYNN